MPTPFVPVKVGTPKGKLFCCGESMQHQDSGIYECRRCDCYVMVDRRVVEHVSRCNRH